MQMRLFRHNTVRHNMCARALLNCPWQEGWGFPWRRPKPELRSVGAWRCFLFDSSSLMAHVGQSSSWELYYPEHSALTAPSGPFLRFSCHSFPLEDSHSTQAPPQIACLVVIKLVSDLVLVTQPRRLVVHIGCCCLWTEEIQPFPLCALFVCSELWGRVAGQGPGCDGEGGEVCFSLLTGRWERALSNS